MNWKIRKERKTFLDKYSIKLPASFCNAFFVLFDELDDEKKILNFLKRINNQMNNEKGNGYIITFEEIIYLRGINSYVKINEYYSKNKHHVVPTSRIKNESKYKKEKIGLPVMFHEAWHICFNNLYGKEIVYFMEKFFSNITAYNNLFLFFKSLEKLQEKIKYN